MSAPAPRADLLQRSDYRYFRSIATRWMDNDAYGHVNNVVYYSFFDTAVNAHLIEAGLLDVVRSPVIGLVVETQCTFKASLAFPALVTAGLRVAHLGRSSVRYDIGLFEGDRAEPAAQGRFVHVYVERATQTPAPIPDDIRTALAELLPPAG